MLELYKKHNVDKDYTSIGLFREIEKKYTIQKVLYPGSYFHITPSLIFSDVTYVDLFRNTYKFYEDVGVGEFVEKNKEYSEEANYNFYGQSYEKDIPEELESFDMIISQYCGFAGRATKKYLKKGAILVCNNSHGDASMASLDPDYELIAVYNRKTDEKFSISEKDLCKYLVSKKDIVLKKEDLEKSMRGIAYTKSPSGYIFKKVK